MTVWFCDLSANEKRFVLVWIQIMGMDLYTKLWGELHLRKDADNKPGALIAPQVGLEPTTPWLTVRCSNQLSYCGIFKNSSNKHSNSFILCQVILKNRTILNTTIFLILNKHLCRQLWRLVIGRVSIFTKKIFRFLQFWKCYR